MQRKFNPEQVFRDLSETLSNSSQNNFFGFLVARLEKMLDVEHVVLSKIVNDGKEVQTVAISSGGQILPNFSYGIEGNPCKGALHEKMFFYNNTLKQQYPNSALLQKFDANSLIGITIYSRDEKPLGVLSILQSQEFSWPELGLEVMHIVASQVGAEMERKIYESQITDLAFQDALTGLPNRTYLKFYVHEAIEMNQQRRSHLALLIVDLKRFKEINDTFGHETGDKLLVAVAQRLESVIGDEGFIARQASDEFTVVLSLHAAQDVSHYAQKIHQAFEQPFRFIQHLFQVRVHIGAAVTSCADYVSDSELFQSASIAVTEAKKMNTPICLYDQELAERLQREHQIYMRLSQAIQDQTLLVYFQPQFDVRTGKLCGAEALCRWFDSELGFIGPDEFIPIAEERGLIIALDALVLKKVTEYLQIWKDANLPLPKKVSVNLSAQQFESIEVIQHLKGITEQIGSEAIVLELTEGVMMRKPDEALRVTQLMKNNGFDIAVDDFGTGYSSLSYLQRFAIQYLKIDRSFVIGLEKNPQNRSIVEAVIAMARSLGMKTIAEGVENSEQQEILSELGCHVLQGFHLGKPIPATEFENSWLKPAIPSYIS